MKSFASFDGATIAYHDEGEGSPVVLLHGYGVDGLWQFGSFERILPILKARQKLFIETFGAAPALPDPPAEGRAGIIPPLLAANACVILPDLRGFGTSAKSREVAFYSDWAMARDVTVLIEHLHVDAGFRDREVLGDGEKSISSEHFTVGIVRLGDAVGVQDEQINGLKTHGYLHIISAINKAEWQTLDEVS